MKTIGIPAAKYDSVFGVNAKYMEFISHFGDVVILTPNTNKEIRKDLDLLVLPGGADTYIEEPYPGYMNIRSNPHLEWFDQYMLPQYVNNGTPIFAICRGFQALNLLLGGSIKQHIFGHNNNISEIAKCEDKFEARQTKDSTAKGLTNTIKINSIHHQAVNELAEGLVPTLISTKPNDGIIEGYKHVELPIQGVQWHPEKIHDDYSIQIIEQLLNYYNEENQETQEDEALCPEDKKSTS